jgi:hypothetical protein
MFTKLLNKFGFVRHISTKQIDNDLQITYNNDNSNIAFLKNVNERDYHIQLRREYLKDDAILLDGTKIKDYKGRYKINKFKNEI